MMHERIYVNPDVPEVYIDTYVANLGDSRPAILVVPGGGYKMVCTDREGEPIALDFVSRGYNAFVLNYRVGEDNHYPDQLLDGASAMVYIRNHAKEFKIDPKRVFAVGFSAGGHLVSTLATMHSDDAVKEYFGEDHLKVKPTGVISSYGVSVLRPNATALTFKRFVGKTEGFTDADVERFSIDRLVNESTAPMFLWHTAEDQTVNPEDPYIVGLALKRAGVNHKICMYPYGPHGIALANETTARSYVPGDVQPLADRWTEDAAEWFDTLPDSEF